MAENYIKNRVQWAFTILFLFITISCNLCANTIIKETDLPDTSYKAIVFKRDCGATTSDSLQLSIIPRAEKLQNTDKGNICITDGDTLLCEAVSGDTLLIKYTGRLFSVKDNFEDITIIYERL